MFESGYIQELFEHWFKLEKTNALSYLHVVKIHYIESNADQTDRFADAFVRENAGYSYDVVTTLWRSKVLQPAPFCLELSSVCKGIF